MIDDPLNSLAYKRGSQLPWAKLNEEDVRHIRLLIEHRESLKRQAAAISNKRIAEKFGVHLRTIDKISAGHGWTHV